MDTPTLAASLSQALVGVRLRVRSRSWLIARAQMIDAALSLGFAEPADPEITIELPETFDPGLTEHRVWLLYNIERQLSDASPAAVADE